MSEKSGVSLISINFKFLGFRFIPVSSLASRIHASIVLSPMFTIPPILPQAPSIVIGSK